MRTRWKRQAGFRRRDRKASEVYTGITKGQEDKQVRNRDKKNSWTATTLKTVVRKGEKWHPM